MVVAQPYVDLAALKQRHPLADVVTAAGVQLRGQGRVRQGRCPFHDETAGSFTVYGDTARFHCFGCGASGDVLDFVQRTEGLTLPQAIRRLDSGTGLAAPARGRSAAVDTRSRPHTTALLPRDPALLTAAARCYHRALWQHPQGRAYLASRGISAATAKRLGLGYASGQGLRRALAAAGFDAVRQRVSGLFVARGAERFAGMVVVPAVRNRQVQWLAGRAIDPERTPRFQTLPGPKPVLGLGRLGPAPSRVVLTEGLFDWLTLVEWGLPAAAVLGTQGLDRVVAALQHCPRVVLAFDADDAGRAAAAQLAELLGQRATTITIPPDVSDVADLATRPDGRAEFRRLLTPAQPARQQRAPSLPRRATEQRGAPPPGPSPRRHRHG